MFKLRYYYKRYYRHMNQSEFAQFLGISQPYLSQLLRGASKKPSAEILLQIATKLNVPMEKLYVKRTG